MCHVATPVLLLKIIPRSDAAAAKRRKTLGVGELGFGSERLWIARRSDYVKSREHKFLKTSGINSTASGFLQIPSVDPKDLFCVQREVKETVARLEDMQTVVAR